MQEPPLFAELLQQAVALFLRERVGQLQALDGDELAEADVNPAVDDAEPAVPTTEATRYLPSIVVPQSSKGSCASSVSAMARDC